MVKTSMSALGCRSLFCNLLYCIVCGTDFITIVQACLKAGIEEKFFKVLGECVSTFTTHTVQVSNGKKSQ